MSGFHSVSRGRAQRGSTPVAAAPFSLTPPLSRWERERRSPRRAKGNALGATAVALRGPLAQRERARVRENGHEV